MRKRLEFLQCGVLELVVRHPAPGTWALSEDTYLPR